MFAYLKSVEKWSGCQKSETFFQFFSGVSRLLGMFRMINDSFEWIFLKHNYFLLKKQFSSLEEFDFEVEVSLN